jgi:hypothetical protein
MTQPLPVDHTIRLLSMLLLCWAAAVSLAAKPIHRIDVIAGQCMEDTALAATQLFGFPVSYENAPARETEIVVYPNNRVRRVLTQVSVSISTTEPRSKIRELVDEYNASSPPTPWRLIFMGGQAIISSLPRIQPEEAVEGFDHIVHIPEARLMAGAEVIDLVLRESHDVFAGWNLVLDFSLPTAVRSCLVQLEPGDWTLRALLVRTLDTANDSEAANGHIFVYGIVDCLLGNMVYLRFRSSPPDAPREHYMNIVSRHPWADAVRLLARQRRFRYVVADPLPTSERHLDTRYGYLDFGYSYFSLAYSDADSDQDLIARLTEVLHWRDRKVFTAEYRGGVWLVLPRAEDDMLTDSLTAQHSLHRSLSRDTTLAMQATLVPADAPEARCGNAALHSTSQQDSRLDWHPLSEMVPEAGASPPVDALAESLGQPGQSIRGAHLQFDPVTSRYSVKLSY